MGQHASLYNSAAWRHRRAQQLSKEPACAYCRRFDGRLVPATVADHLVPHRGDSALFAGPLQSLCATCHASRKQQQERGGIARGCDSAGIPTDPAHPWCQELDEPPGGVSAPKQGRRL